MTVEALLVTGSEQRESLKPTDLEKPSRVLAEPHREYLALTGKNVFTGSASGGRLTENRDQVLGAVRLTMIFQDARDRWEATYWDQNTGPDERVLNTRFLTDFVIKDRYDNTLVQGKVVRIDSKGVIFKADSRYYRWECGDYLQTTLRRSLRDEEVKSLGLATAMADEEKDVKDESQ
jgi:hypothetical protein